ncbi:helix-turn-helix domain-containing protein [Cupriavidus pauculus]|uniref:helix-turn-helix domain-containing protein n=1 Tax=Cupriavidus pauculus TaxID=82633 RepID=UPI001EE2C6B3|nr:helix-turn-helix transcriptional regulator [Cupriavidus pauculus]GJG92869.1 helix-turn-helix transcriptional regulator [Cupriavidus pauculus]
MFDHRYSPPYIGTMTIATRLDRLMRARNVKSQSALARMTGVPQPTINRILKGQTDTPELGTIKKIATTFNVPATWLAEGPGDDPPNVDPRQGSAGLLVAANMSLEERVRSAQLEAANHLIGLLPSAVLSKLLGALQQSTETSDFSVFDTPFDINLDDVRAKAAKEISGGEPDPVPQSNKRLKTR